MTTTFNDQQLDQLRKEFSGIERVNPSRIHRIFDDCSTTALKQLAAAKIRFVSVLARNAMARREGRF